MRAFLTVVFEADLISDVVTVPFTESSALPTSMKYEVKFTTQFKKDIKLAKKQNKNLNKLFEVIDSLAQGKNLESKYKDHERKNEWQTSALDV